MQLAFPLYPHHPRSRKAATSAVTSIFCLDSNPADGQLHRLVNAERIIPRKCSLGDPLQRRTLWLQSQYRRLSIRKGIHFTRLGAV